MKTYRVMGLEHIPKHFRFVAETFGGYWGLWMGVNSATIAGVQAVRPGLQADPRARWAGLPEAGGQEGCYR